MITAGEWGNIKPAGIVDEITLSYHDEERKLKWELGIEMVEFREGDRSMRVRMYSDSWRAYKENREVFEVLNEFAGPSQRDDRGVWDAMIERLQAAGWTRVKPQAKEPARELCCTSSGRP